MSAVEKTRMSARQIARLTNHINAADRAASLRRIQALQTERDAAWNVSIELSGGAHEVLEEMEDRIALGPVGNRADADKYRERYDAKLLGATEALRRFAQRTQEIEALLMTLLD